MSEGPLWGSLHYPLVEYSPTSVVPLSSEYGTYQTVMARFWPWLTGKRNAFKLFPLCSEVATVWIPNGTRGAQERERASESASVFV